VSAGILAPGYQAVVAALRLFRPRVPNMAEVAQVRARVSSWIERQRLPYRGRVIRHESPGWCIFKNSENKNSENPRSHVFYVHGGGLVFYSVEDFSSLMEQFAVDSECEVTAFHYPKAPEHGAHEILEAIAVQAGRRLAEIPAGSPVIFAGDSIGAYIALYLVLRRFPRRFDRLVLIYPVLDLSIQRPSYAIYGRGYCLNAEMMTWFQSFWQTGKKGADELTPFCLSAEDHRNLPPVAVFSAEADVLRDEAFDWCEYLQANHLSVEHHHMPDLAHDFCLYAGKIPEARAAVDLIASQFQLQKSAK
jgi:acetyl esterase